LMAHGRQIREPFLCLSHYQVQVDRFIFGLFQQIQLSVLLLFTRFYASHRFSLSAFVLSFAVPSYSEPTQKGNDKCIRVSIQ
ncbi:MAG: hypothetical protein J5932_03020, partial [Prevotella sp.]|nr:hypothetical protein [Prevotella sp.]